MQTHQRVYIASFIMSAAGVMPAKAGFFYARSRLGFGEYENLLLGLLGGCMFLLCALCSHGVAMRVGARRLLLGSIVAQVMLQVVLWAAASPWTVYGCMPLSVGLWGFIWPVMESYAVAGRTPTQASRALGGFNVAWASGNPLGLILAGPLIASQGAGLFLVGAGLMLTVLPRLAPLSAEPTHLPDDHPERLTPQQTAELRAFLISSRWIMLGGGIVLNLVTPLLPSILERDLGIATTWSTSVAALIDISRFAAFVIFQHTIGWHGRRAAHYLAALALPISFILIRSSVSVPTVILGEVMLGLLHGAAFHLGLYYGALVKHASVDAGGKHEAMAGVGIVVGPVTGLASKSIAAWASGPTLGLAKGAGLALGSALAVGPIIALTTVGGIWPLRRHITLTPASLPEVAPPPAHAE